MKTEKPDCKENEVSLYISDGRGMRWQFAHQRSTSADARSLYILLSDEHDRQEGDVRKAKLMTLEIERRLKQRIAELESRVFAYQGVVGRQRKEIARLRAEQEGQSS